MMGMMNTSRSSNLVFFFRLYYHGRHLPPPLPLLDLNLAKPPLLRRISTRKLLHLCLGTSWCEYVSRYVCRGLQGIFLSLFFFPRRQGRRHGSRWIVSEPASKLYPVAEKSSCSSNYFPHT